MDSAHRRFSLTTSVFRNEVGNALVQSGATDLNAHGHRYNQAAGTRRRRGIEVAVEARPVPAARVSGSFTLLDAVYTGEAPSSAATTVAIPGSRAEKSPRIAASLWAFVQPRAGRFARIGLGGGLVYQAERLGGNGARTPSAPDPLMLPASTRIDLTSTCRITDRIDLTVHVENAFDSLVFVSGSVGSALEVASPRAVMVRVGARLFR